MSVDTQGVVRDLEAYRDELAYKLLDMEGYRHQDPEMHVTYNVLRVIFHKVNGILLDNGVPSYRQEEEE